MKTIVKLTAFECFLLFSIVNGDEYLVDSSAGLGRKFDGIGGLSGGGATSKLLVNYAEPYRSQILDYLFKPNFGASLQILKVEIGGDSQTTDGTESSHMHESWDENYSRGYEWWLMVEAKKRNPAIKLYGLPWAFPGWLSQGKKDPYGYPNVTATYITKWVLGAKKYYNLDIDYLGIWNERPYNIQYVETLRQTLDASGLKHIQLVVADGGWEVANDTVKHAAFGKVVDYIGVHYPGTLSPDFAVNTGKPLWSSEDYSTFNDDVGAGCWARILNQNYVNGFMTSTISWNLIASYYQALPFGRDGLMTAQEPWSGHYRVESPIWITAHTTYFTEIGWHYLKHGYGVGKLNHGGSFVSLLSPSGKDFTMVIETMSHNHSKCIRPRLPEYTVTSQVASFTLTGGLQTINKLQAWVSRLKFDGSKDNLFVPAGVIQVEGGMFSLKLAVDEVHTLTTLERKPPKLFPDSPPTKPFPLPYNDTFENYPEYSEAFDFAPQEGVWEVREGSHKGHGKVNRQVVLHHPCHWCKPKGRGAPINIGGSHDWADVFVQLDVLMPSVNGTEGVFLAARVTKGGCAVHSSQGIFFFLFPANNSYLVARDIERIIVLKSGALKEELHRDWWYHMSLIVRGTKAYGFLGIDEVFQITIPAKPKHGFVAYGASSYGLADYDNVHIQDSGWMYLRARNDLNK